MATLSRPQRKKEQPDLFTPIGGQEEMTLRQALQTSLRPIPLNGLVSEDEVTSNDEVLDEEDREIEFIDEKNNGDEYEMKWSQLRAQINVGSLINLSGATKILSSQQTAKSFFDFMFQRQH